MRKFAFAPLLLGAAGIGYVYAQQSLQGSTMSSISTPEPPGPMTKATSVEQVKAHVTELARNIGERNLWRPEALRRAADYVRATWSAQGYSVAAQDYAIDGSPWSNLEITRPGTSRPSEIILIGAHYDSVIGSPGANDNGSGVASLLELSRRIASERPQRTVRFVAFVNEEPPFFKTERMGSRVYARAARGRGDDIRAMFSLETMGYFSDTPDSQRYPPLFNLFYPDTGNFIAFVANFQSRALMQRAVDAFRSGSDFPVEHVATFGFVPGVDWSDHGSFWKSGYPAVMITDTALYRYPYYHSHEDTPDKVNYARLARVTDGLVNMIWRLANGD